MKSVGIRIFKHIINVLATILIGSVAFVFVLLGLSYKATDFLAANHAQIASIIYGIIFILILAYVILYIFDKKTAYRLIIFTLICFALFSVIFYIICASGLISKITSIQALREYISQAGSMAIILFIIFQFLQVVVLPVPGSVSVAAGVALFGPLECAIYSFIGITVGSFIAFIIGRYIGYRAVSWIVGKENLHRWMQKIKGKDYLILSIMFLLPLFPDDILCFVAGLSSMSWGYFAIMITLTRALSVFTTAYSFGFIPLNTWWGIAIWAILIVIVAVLFWIVYKYSDKIDEYLKRMFKINSNKKQ